ncbi:TPA: hypothetical protein ACGCT2_002976 [Vibrio cholerae O1]|uniref:hypothetical protein n=1 Tax=Vibrio cholerae TaxID=666 RepID=UPI00165831B7|nr:hypothetical protein [Vibrio cholerae]EGR0592958.1 hypothetical protein [Vibrio cholerae]EKF9265876.1 hypothetical protein [Vibrio cholerae]MBC9069465.1 hypothetical protein [Vibrio cholerae]HAS2771670.1 hypothetical protein [Vibrio cholerae]HAS5089864.1 hypothetical protein [Vibrio cholerae]
MANHKLINLEISINKRSALKIAREQFYKNKKLTQLTIRATNVRVELSYSGSRKCEELITPIILKSESTMTIAQRILKHLSAITKPTARCISQLVTAHEFRTSKGEEKFSTVYTYKDGSYLTVTQENKVY